MTDESKIIQHKLVPEHLKLTEEQKRHLLQNFNISVKQLPMIKLSDPTIKSLNLKVNDVIQVKRKSATAREADYYRVVVDG